MNIEAPSTKITETTSTTASTTNVNTAAKDDSASFKSQLDAVKTQDTKAAQATEAEATKTAEDTKTATAIESQKNATTQQTKVEDIAKNNLAQQVDKDKLADSKLAKDKNSAKSAEITDPIAELSSKIATLSELKTGVSKTQGVSSKTKETIDKTDLCTTIKMDNKDVTFFLNLVENQQMSAQAAQGSSFDSTLAEFSDIKSEATQQSVQVSSTLLAAMNEAAKTGKPFRIDFDSDVAVIMKMDKNGTISANFIPGDTAVENYLRNNIAGLRQSFDDQGLAYNELSYTKQQKQEQQEKRKNNKENENE